jgi:hypothetical protein
MSTLRFGVLCAVPFWLSMAATPAAAQADSTTDACTVLTPAQVSAVVGVSVGPGQHVTPTFVKTCTWTAPGDTTIAAVTLYMQSAADYDGGKQMAGMMVASSGAAALKSGGVGDDSYYFVAGTQVGLLVKKGSVSFKVAVYARLPVERKEAMELALAKAALAKF